MFECWNPNCPNYRGGGVRLDGTYVFPDAANRLHCKACGSYVRKAPANDGDEASRGLIGASGGALVGAALGGPPGALVGAIIGSLVGLASGPKNSR